MVEDDTEIGNMLSEILTKAGYEVKRAFTGVDAGRLLQNRGIDLVLLDLMLPDIGGEKVLESIRGDIPVIVVSARRELSKRVDLLLNGAVDYVTKPFHVEELLARIAAQLRGKKDMDEKDTLSYQELTLRLDSRRLFINGEAVKLTNTEFCILEQLMGAPKRVISKSRLLDVVSEFSPDCHEDSLKVPVSKLRQKLREATGKDYIETVWGLGFKLKEF